MAATCKPHRGNNAAENRSEGRLTASKKLEPALLASSDPLIRFEQFLRIRNKSEDTIKRYKFVVSEFLNLTGPKDVYDTNDVEEFLIYLRTKQKKHYASEVRPSVGGTYLRFVYYSLKTFFRSQKFEWDLEKEDVPAADVPTRLYYTMDEMNKVIKAIRKENTQKDGKLSQMGCRDLLAFRVVTLAFTRRKSLQLLRRWDYNKDRGTITMPSVKKGRQPVVELDKETKDLMDYYLTRRTDIYSALFPSFRPRNDQGSISVGYLNELLKYYALKAGVPYKGMHAFRRGMVTYFFEQGLREREIFEMGDWKTEAMVSKYVQLSPKFSREKRTELHPFFRKEVPTSTTGVVHGRKRRERHQSDIECKCGRKLDGEEAANGDWIEWCSGCNKLPQDCTCSQKRK